MGCDCGSVLGVGLPPLDRPPHAHRQLSPTLPAPRAHSLYPHPPPPPHTHTKKHKTQLAEEKREAEEEMARLRARHETEAGDLRARIQDLLEREERRDGVEQVGGLGVCVGG